MSQTPTTDNIFHRVLRGKWKQISYGRGVYLFDTEGQRYLDACAALDINIPIVPGIMPITNYQGIVRFSKNCGAEIPRWILKHLESYEDDPESLKAFGLDAVTKLCHRLLEGGAPGLHFYTLNQSLPTIHIWRNLDL